MSRAVLGLLLACACAPAPASPLSPVIGSAPEPAAAPTEPETSEPAEAPRKSDLYRATYGDTGPTLVYLHGGPGHNASLFEASAADPLSASYRVVVYDRRGTGRSPAAQSPEAFTFEQATRDLDAIIAGADEPVLLAHSFGGMVAMAYLEAHPDFSGRVILLNVPIDFQRTLTTIISNCREVYTENGNEDALGVLGELEALDPASAQYLGATFSIGIRCGLYSPATPTPEAKAIYAGLARHEHARWFSDMQPMPTFGFIENEHYNTLDLSRSVELHNAKISAIYGDEDRIISPEDRAFLRQTLGERYVEIEGAAHNAFVDQQPAFIEALKRLTSPADSHGRR